MKKTKLVVLMMVIVTVMGFAVNGFAGTGDSKFPKGKPQVFQTTCPVMGGKINKKLYVDYKGKRIYVCCGGCISTVKADPEKYIKKLEKEGVTVMRVSSHNSGETQHAKAGSDEHSGHQH